MDLQGLCSVLGEIFGEKNVKSNVKGFRIVIEYDNMPYCIVLTIDQNRLFMNPDIVDAGEHNYEAAYKKTYKILASNKDRLCHDIVI